MLTLTYRVCRPPLQTVLRRRLLQKKRNTFDISGVADVDAYTFAVTGGLFEQALSEVSKKDPLLMEIVWLHADNVSSRANYDLEFT